MILGIHCSVLRGYQAALEEAVALGCGAMQMLPYRRHHVPAREETAAFAAARAKSGVSRFLAHSRFVPSLASSTPERRRRSVELLRDELRLSRELGAEGYVLHAGAYAAGGDVKEGIRLVVSGIAEAAPAAEGMSILIENVPGGGRRIGGSLEELAELFGGVAGRGTPTGVCLDTAHAWAAGYDIASVEGMLKFLARAHRLVGAENVRAFHLNDTRALLGSHREHHWHWGEGRLGSEGLKTLLERSEYRGAVGIVETPKGSDQKNLDYVRVLNHQA